MQMSASYAAPDEVDASAIWSAIRRGKMRLIVTTLAAGLATFAILSLLTPKFLSEARILIEPDKSSLTRPLSERASQPLRIDKETVISQVEVLRSRDLHAAVAERLDLAGRPEFNAAKRQGVGSRLLSLIGIGAVDRRLSERERVLKVFEKGLAVYPVTNSRVITVAFSSPDPKLAADVANTLADTYIDWQQGRRVSRNKGASDWLGKRITELRRDVERAEARLAGFRAKAGLVAGRNNLTLNAQQLSEINTQLNLARAQRSESEARARQIRTMLARGTVAAAPDVLKSPLIQRLLEQRARVERQQSELSATLLPAHPRMRQLRAELTGLGRQLQGEARKIVEALESEAKIAGARERSLAESLGMVRKDTESSSDDQAKLQVLERDARSKRALYEAYAVRYGDANARHGRQAVPVYARIFEHATPSSIPSFPKKGPITVLIMVATMLLGIAFLVTRELLVGMQGVQGVARPVAMVQHENDARGGGQSMAGDPNPGRGIRAPVFGAGGKTGAMTSLADLASRLVARAGAGQGYRTFVTGQDEHIDPMPEAAGLARELSGHGERVLLIAWGGPNGPESRAEAHPRKGLRDLVAGMAEFEDVVEPHPVHDYHVVTEGSADVDAGPDDESERLGLIFDAFDEIYEHIVLCARRQEAGKLFAMIEERCDTGVVVANQGRRRNAPAEPAGQFLERDVSALDIVRYERSRERRKRLLPTGLSGRAASL